MSWDMFIVPITLIIVQLAKRIKKLDANWLPYIAVILGAAMGALYALYYGGDIFEKTMLGLFFGASASGIYDAGASGKDLYQQSRK